MALGPARKGVIRDAAAREQLHRGRDLEAAEQPVHAQLQCDPSRVKASFWCGTYHFHVADRAGRLDPPVELGERRAVHADVLETDVPKACISMKMKSTRTASPSNGACGDYRRKLGIYNNNSSGGIRVTARNFRIGARRSIESRSRSVAKSPTLRAYGTHRRLPDRDRIRLRPPQWLRYR